MKYINEPVEIRGKSTDIKPKNVPYGSTFYEIDTLKTFKYQSTRLWTEDISSGGINSYLQLTDTTDINYTNKENFVPSVNGTALTLENPNFFKIEAALVTKLTGNINNRLIEIGDVVFFKTIENAGNPLILIGDTYIGGNKQLATSYQKNVALNL